MNTAVQEIIEYLERVESKGIESVSITKLKQRIKSKLPKEKKNLLMFYDQGLTNPSSGESFYNQTFNTNDQ